MSRKQHGDSPESHQGEAPTNALASAIARGRSSATTRRTRRFVRRGTCEGGLTPQAIITCARCGTVKPKSGSARSLCGSLDQSVTVELVGVESHAEVDNVGTVAEERDASRKQFRVGTQTPKGARSHEVLADGVVSLNIHGPTQTGRKGETRAVDTLLSRLRQERHRPVLEAGRDERGEDGILLLQDERLTLQVVSVPSCPNLWREANRDSAMTSVPVAGAAKWIRDAIFAKFTNTSPAERAKTIVLLDAGLAGVLSAHEVADAYLALYGDPHLEFGLASTWLVGPTSSTTTRLGTGRP